MKVQEIKTFGSAFNGKTPSKLEQRSEGLAILKIRDIDENGRFRGNFESFVDPSYYEKYSNKRLQTGDTIILNAAHNSDYVGSKNAFISPELNGVVATGEWLIVRVNNAHPAYINHFLKSPPGRRKLKICVKGIHLYPKDVERIKIPLPPIADQKRIAYLLGKVEGLIAQRKQHLQHLDDLLKSVFLEMFGDPVRNEKGWEKRTAIDYADCIVPGRDKPKSFSGDIPWVTTNDLKNLGFTHKSLQDSGLTEDEIEEVRARIIPSGSVLITCVGDLGVSSICANDMVVNQQLHSFQVRENINNIFFMFALSFQKSFMYRNASQTTVPYMNKTICNRIPMIAPPTVLQHQFATIVEKVEGIKSRYQASLTDLETLYGALSQKAFKGELDLSRVSLPPDGTEAAEPPEPNEPTTTDTFDLPAPSDPATLNSTEGRKTLLDQWLTLWLERLNGTPLATQAFIESAQQRLWELAEEDALDLGVAEYDRVQAWILASLERRHLAQTYNDDKNRVQLKAVSHR